MLTVTQSALNQLRWQKRKIQANTHKIICTHTVPFKSADSISVRGKNRDGRDSKTSKAKTCRRNVKKAVVAYLWLWGNIPRTHTHMHTPQLTCHGGHFAYWTWLTNKLVIKAEVTFPFSSSFFTLFLSLYPNSPSGKLAGCLGCWRNCFQTSCKL